MKDLGYLLEHDEKALSSLLLNDAKIMAEFISTIVYKDELSAKALAFLKSRYCSSAVINSLLSLIKQLVDSYLELENPKRDDLRMVYSLMFAATMLTISSK